MIRCTGCGHPVAERTTSGDVVSRHRGREVTGVTSVRCDRCRTLNRMTDLPQGPTVRRGGAKAERRDG